MCLRIGVKRKRYQGVKRFERSLSLFSNICVSAPCCSKHSSIGPTFMYNVATRTYLQLQPQPVHLARARITSVLHVTTVRHTYLGEFTSSRATSAAITTVTKHATLKITLATIGKRFAGTCT